MSEDPVIDRIRATRHRISERFGHNTKALMDHYRELEEEYRHRMLREPAPAGTTQPSPSAPQER